MTAGQRKLVLTAHITTSVGWLGAVGGFLALAVAGLRAQDAELARGVYVAMDWIGWTVIVPLSFASLLTGLIQSLGGKWGLFRHHWVVAKLFLNLLAVVVLLVHMRPIDYMAEVAAKAPLAMGDLHAVRIQLVVESSAGLFVLLVATILSVYKPKGTMRISRPRPEGTGSPHPLRR